MIRVKVTEKLQIIVQPFGFDANLRVELLQNVGKICRKIFKIEVDKYLKRYYHTIHIKHI